ncbi:hypothetical protein [Aureitalea marina]|uniref:Uncharacterized protein n=1 Tax=Aureitalea marina TaxID=930804 RepID=A0A2S7KRT8_9FLAO|nr:hypothetical protein [Aureitalea marina]PQB05298.1 hypothetical protein BST85_10690 [Aureitalea marina]
MSKRQFQLASVFMLICIISLGVATGTISKESIKWGERPLEWSDFVTVGSIDGEFDASVHTNIIYPDLIEPGSSKVIAVMNPNLSNKTADSTERIQLLKHEQYHFNVTEYYARLMRKQIVELGRDGVSENLLDEIYQNTMKKIDSFQQDYDNESDHNRELEEQLYYQLYIDDLLLQTAYYENPDILSYSRYTRDSTRFFRQVLTNRRQGLLKSYPISEEESQFGNSYEIIQKDGDVLIYFRKNGKLNDGGYFDSAMTKIIGQGTDTVELQLFNARSAWNTELDNYRRRIIFSKNESTTIQYFDSLKNPSSNGNVHKLVFDRIADSLHKEKSSYYDLQGRLTKNKDSVFHEIRYYDQLGRIIQISNFDKNNKGILDKELIGTYSYNYDENHNVVRLRLYDQHGRFAHHANRYHQLTSYDSRGNIHEIISLDSAGDRMDDIDGVCVYRMTYDLNDNMTSQSKFNKSGLPVQGTEEFQRLLTVYDDQDRLIRNATYYGDYVLKFDEVKNGLQLFSYPNDSTSLMENYDAYGNLFANDQGYAMLRTVDSDNGLIRREYHLDTLGNYAITANGVNVYEYHYDKKGQMTLKIAMDSTMNPVPFDGEASKVVWTYDIGQNQKRTIVEHFHQGLAVGSDAGVHRYVYDETLQDFLLKESYFDTMNNPVDIDGSHQIEYVMNRMGKDSLQINYNTAGEPIDGIARTRYHYNWQGSVIAIEYQDKNGRRIEDQEGISLIQYKRNQKQQIRSTKYFDSKNRTATNSLGVHEEEIVYAENGFIDHMKYYGKRNIPVPGPNGFHKVAYSWSDYGEAIRLSTYGTDNKLLENELGIAEEVYQRYPSGMIRKVEFLDKEGNPTEDEDGIATYIYEPSVNGLYYLEQQLDADSNEVGDSAQEE